MGRTGLDLLLALGPALPACSQQSGPPPYSATGSWSAYTSAGDGLQYTLSDGGGSLSGSLHFKTSSSLTHIYEGAVSGMRSGMNADWNTAFVDGSGSARVTGSFEGDVFSGFLTLRYPDGTVATSGTINLTRGSNAAAAPATDVARANDASALDALAATLR